MPRNSSESLRETFCIAVIAAGADLCAPGNWVPCSIGPFDGAVLSHRSSPPRVLISLAAPWRPRRHAGSCESQYKLHSRVVVLFGHHPRHACSIHMDRGGRAEVQMKGIRVSLPTLGSTAGSDSKDVNRWIGHRDNSFKITPQPSRNV